MSCICYLSLLLLYFILRARAMTKYTIILCPMVTARRGRSRRDEIRIDNIAERMENGISVDARERAIPGRKEDRRRWLAYNIPLPPRPPPSTECCYDLVESFVDCCRTKGVTKNGIVLVSGRPISNSIYFVFIYSVVRKPYRTFSESRLCVLYNVL